MDFKKLISHFEVVRCNTHSVQCICPGHNDKVASLTITKGRGKSLIYCHAGCKVEDVIAAAGLKMGDLYEKKSINECDEFTEKWKYYVIKREGKEIEAVYHYYDYKNQYAFTKIRLVGKKMIFGILSNDRFSYGLNGNKRKNIQAVYGNLYNLCKSIEEKQMVFYCEGEKDVDTLQKHGYHAVTAGGVCDWQKDYSFLFRDARVCVLADNDEKGIALAERVCKDLCGVANEIYLIIPMPELKKGDISDYFATHDENEFRKLIQNAQPFGNSIKRKVEKNIPLDLSRFHNYNEKGKVTSVFDWEIVKFLKENNDMFILRKTVYIYRNGVYKADITGAILQTEIRKLIFPTCIKSNTIERIHKLLLMDIDLHINYENINCYPASWINFQNAFWDPINKCMVEHNPKYMAINQIPYEYNPEDDFEGKTIDKWFDFIFSSEDDKEMFLEYAGYCMTRDVRQQKCLLIIGEGGSGKSTLINLLSLMVGDENISNVSLEELSKTFMPYELLGKLMNACADLELAVLEKTAMLKKVIGEDKIMGQRKYHDAFPFRNYAKLVFSENQLPIVKSERTNGFYRRLLLLTMNNVPNLVIPEFQEKIAMEINYFIHISVAAVERMYTNGRILESEDSKKLVDELRYDLDPIEGFLKQKTVKDKDKKTDRSILYELYCNYCLESERLTESRVEFYNALRAKGFSTRKSNGKYFIIGLSIKKNNNIVNERL